MQTQRLVFAQVVLALAVVPHEEVVVVESLQPKLQVVASLAANLANHVEETHIAIDCKNRCLHFRCILLACIEVISES